VKTDALDQKQISGGSPTMHGVDMRPAALARSQTGEDDRVWNACFRRYLYLTISLCLISLLIGISLAASPNDASTQQRDTLTGACLTLAMAEAHGFIHPDRRRQVLRALADQPYPLRHRLPASAKEISASCELLAREDQ
jgi:hypothetical protein